MEWSQSFILMDLCATSRHTPHTSGSVSLTTELPHDFWVALTRLSLTNESSPATALTLARWLWTASMLRRTVTLPLPASSVTVATQFLLGAVEAAGEPVAPLLREAAEAAGVSAAADGVAAEAGVAGCVVGGMLPTP